MIAKVSGQIVTADIITNDGGKASRVIQLLQVGEKGAELIKLKDKDLNSMYKIGSRCEFSCNVQPWEMNGRSGISCSVISHIILKDNKSGVSDEVAPFNKAA